LQVSSWTPQKNDIESLRRKKRDIESLCNFEAPLSRLMPNLRYIRLMMVVCLHHFLQLCNHYCLSLLGARIRLIVRLFDGDSMQGVDTNAKHLQGSTPRLLNDELQSRWVSIKEIWVYEEGIIMNGFCWEDDEEDGDWKSNSIGSYIYPHPQYVVKRLKKEEVRIRHNKCGHDEWMHDLFCLTIHLLQILYYTTPHWLLHDMTKPSLISSVWKENQVMQNQRIDETIM